MIKGIIGRFGAAAVGATVFGGALATTAAAQAEIEPGTAAPGDAVELLIDCGEDADGASVSLAEFGGASEAALHEVEDHPGIFVGGMEVPSVEPGDYTLSLTCSDGTSDTVSLTVAPAGSPDTGAGESGTSGQLLLVGGAVAGAAVAGGLLVRRRTADSSES